MQPCCRIRDRTEVRRWPEAADPGCPQFSRYRGVDRTWSKRPESVASDPERTSRNGLLDFVGKDLLRRRRRDAERHHCLGVIGQTPEPARGLYQIPGFTQLGSDLLSGNFSSKTVIFRWNTYG